MTENIRNLIKKELMENPEASIKDIAKKYIIPFEFVELILIQTRKNDQ
ncbi:hypothetical protein ACQKMN_13210 [Ureibacillus composti]